MDPVAALFVYVWPEPHSSAAGVRTLELMRNLRTLGYDPVLLSPCKENDASARLNILGFRTLPCPANDSSVEAFLAPLHASLVVYDRFVMEEQMGWRARSLWPGALHLVDTQDLHSLRRARERLLASGASPGQVMSLEGADFSSDLDRELASLYRADAALVVSEREKEWLVGQGYAEDRVFWLPFGAAPMESAPGFGERRGFCFLGNFRHAPNLDAVNWLVKEIWPAIRRRLPEEKLCLYGSYPPVSVSGLHGKNGIELHSSVADHRAALCRHRLLLAPLRFGAGIKGKVLEAWATGTVVVGTPVAMEGFSYPAESEALAHEALVLHEDENEWHARQALGWRALAPFAPERLLRELRSILQVAGAKKIDWRRDIVTRMLKHHQQNSTKYFSQWIEEKNKKRRE